MLPAVLPELIAAGAPGEREFPPPKPDAAWPVATKIKEGPPLTPATLMSPPPAVPPAPPLDCSKDIPPEVPPPPAPPPPAATKIEVPNVVVPPAPPARFPEPAAVPAAPTAY